MTDSYVSVERGSTDVDNIQYGLAIVTLTRADALNAINVEMAQQLNKVMDDLYHDETVRCVVLRAEGRFFMAGGDLPRFAEPIKEGNQEGLIEEIDTLIKSAHEAIRWIRYMNKPVVGLIPGGAAGYGFSLMLACDFVITQEDATFTLAYSGLGTSPDGGSTFFLPRLLGTRKATEIILLSERFTGAQALELGLVNQALPANEMEAALDKLVGRLLSGPTFCYGRSKSLINSSVSSSLSDQLEAEARSFKACALTDDFKEGVTAFVDKRKPEFKGK
ncbi:MAG: enoyl-CoA hydratase [Gammaproteobacteria bacterium]|nr:MAG: enoyl-CoA hydratase [Gammaproteobacteria bacterium]